MLSHEKLIVYKKSVEFAREVSQLIRSFTPGNSDISTQLRRASISISLNIAEGAGRTGKADKRRFYSIARGSALECASILDLVVIWELASDNKIQNLRSLLTEIISMTSTLSTSIK